MIDFELKEIERISRMINKYEQKRVELIKALKENCPHPEELCVTQRRYVEGGYLNVSYDEVWRECTRCKTCSTIKTNYGGFA